MIKKLFLLILIFNLFCGILYAEEYYTNEQICEAIFWAEGGYQTRYPYGIKSVYCANMEDCKIICLNTIRNNRIRYEEYGYKKYKTFLEFLASRYCPISINGCGNWLPNVKFYLNK